MHKRKIKEKIMKGPDKTLPLHDQFHAYIPVTFTQAQCLKIQRVSSQMTTQPDEKRQSSIRSDQTKSKSKRKYLKLVSNPHQKRIETLDKLKIQLPNHSSNYGCHSHLRRSMLFNRQVSKPAINIQNDNQLQLLETSQSIQKADNQKIVERLLIKEKIGSASIDSDPQRQRTYSAHHINHQIVQSIQGKQHSLRNQSPMDKNLTHAIQIEVTPTILFNSYQQHEQIKVYSPIARLKFSQQTKQNILNCEPQCVKLEARYESPSARVTVLHHTPVNAMRDSQNSVRQFNYSPQSQLNPPISHLPQHLMPNLGSAQQRSFFQHPHMESGKSIDIISTGMVSLEPSLITIGNRKLQTADKIYASNPKSEMMINKRTPKKNSIQKIHLVSKCSRNASAVNYQPPSKTQRQQSIRTDRDNNSTNNMVSHSIQINQSLSQQNPQSIKPSSHKLVCPRQNNWLRDIDQRSADYDRYILEINCIEEEKKVIDRRISKKLDQLSERANSIVRMYSQEFKQKQPLSPFRDRYLHPRTQSLSSNVKIGRKFEEQQKVEDLQEYSIRNHHKTIINTPKRKYSKGNPHILQSKQNLQINSREGGKYAESRKKIGEGAQNMMSYVQLKRQKKIETIDVNNLRTQLLNKLFASFFLQV